MDPVEPLQPRASNGMGIAGFVVSLLGIPTCGIASPLGLIFSLIGLRKQPKGLAIAGTIIGGLGTAFLALFGIGIVSNWDTIKPAAETGMALVELQTRIEGYRKENGEIPDAEKGTELLDGRKDGWGNPFRYERTGGGYVLRSAGPDGEYGTADDLKTIR